MKGTNSLGSVIGGRKIMRFALPSIIMMVFISSYSIVDGLFVSSWLGTDALAALNLTMPAFNIIGAIGFMFATGGSAYVSTLLGRGKKDEADRALFQIFVTVTVLALLLTVLGYVFSGPLVTALGADSVLKPLTLDYWEVLVLFIPFTMVQYVALQFLIVIRKPQISLVASVANGTLNIFLDWVFIDVFEWGLGGAAFASGLGSLTAFSIAMYVLIRRNDDLHFTRCGISPKVIVPVCTNGISEMATNLAGAVTSYLFNIMMMRYAGADGVSAISIIMYVEFLAIAAVAGYSSGIAPVMSYDRGADDRPAMQGLYHFSMLFVIAFSVTVFVLMELFAGNVVDLFASDSPEVSKMATDGARIYSFAFLFMGTNVYASALFTSLSNGKISAIISGIRSLILLAPLIVLLPTLFGIDTIWFAVPVTEIITVMISMWFIKRLGPSYGFIKGTTV